MDQAAEIKIVPGRCIGAGNCVVEADSYFDQSDDDGLVIVLKSAVPSEDRRLVERAANVCPVTAILVQDTEEAG